MRWEKVSRCRCAGTGIKPSASCSSRKRCGGELWSVCNGYGAKGVTHSSNWNYTTLKQRGEYDERSKTICVMSMHKALNVKSRVRGDFHARFCERVMVKLPRSTRPLSHFNNLSSPRNCRWELSLFWWQVRWKLFIPRISPPRSRHLWNHCCIHCESARM